MLGVELAPLKLPHVRETYTLLTELLGLWWKMKINGLIDWLIDYLLFYVPLKNFSLIWRRHHYRWRAAKLRPMLGAQGLWAGRDLYRVTPAVTRGIGFSGLIQRTAPFNSHLLRHTRGCGGSILTQILTGKRNFKKWNWVGYRYINMYIKR
jgi:hypothetical protein